ncbi:hypothetical protein HanIR_Chr14g0684441 [Helianthus annuus]|nr:hypothetical protein HanIR_Chr14g0684441 [Helianthus annuus]
MVHKFMSYLGVPLNSSFSIDRTLCDIQLLFIFARKHCLFVSLSIENLLIFVGTSIQINFVEPSFDCKRGDTCSVTTIIELFQITTTPCGVGIERFMQNTGDTCSITAIIELFHSLRHLVVSV